MAKSATVAVVLALASAGQVRSQGNPLTSDVKQDFASVRDFVVRSAEKMPAEKYAFKPSPDVRTFAQQIAHIADDQYNLCAGVRGESRKDAYMAIEHSLSRKDELVPALKSAFAYCQAAYDNLTDANGAGTPASGRRPTNFSMLNWNLWHTWEHYGNIVVYLRMNGLVPPSSEGSASMAMPGMPMSMDQLVAPVRLDATGKFQGQYARVGDSLFITGQPTEAGLRELKSQGVTTIVNLRTPPEMAKVGFDEAALAKDLGMAYVYLPVRGDPEFPYSPAIVTKFAEAVSHATGKVLLHCTVAWRASHLWAAYLIAVKHVDVEAALANARLIALDDTNPMMVDKGPQPIEEFLGRRLPTLGHPKK